MVSQARQLPRSQCLHSGTAVWDVLTPDGHTLWTEGTCSALGAGAAGTPAQRPAVWGGPALTPGSDRRPEGWCHVVPSGPMWSSVDPGLRVEADGVRGGGPFSGPSVTSFPCFIQFGFLCPGPFCGCHRSPLGFQGLPEYWL